MNKFFRHSALSICLTLLLTSPDFFGQSRYNDARLWLNIYIEKKITKNFILHLNQKDRFDRNVSHYELGYADIGITYKFTKNIKILLDYVPALKLNKYNYFGYRQQYYAALIFSREFGRWKAMYRNMFQVNQQNIHTSELGRLPRYYDRSKLTIKYEATKRLSYYIAEELYLIVNNPLASGISRSRSYAGMFINVTRHQAIELYFCLQAQIQKVNWYKVPKKYPNSLLENDYIYGIGYSFSF